MSTYKLQTAWSTIPKLYNKDLKGRNWLDWWLSNRTEQLQKEGEYNKEKVGYSAFQNPIRYKEQYQSELSQDDPMKIYMELPWRIGGRIIYGATDKSNQTITWGDDNTYWSAQAGWNPYGKITDFQMPLGVRIPETVRVHEYTHERFPESHGYVKEGFKSIINDPYIDKEDEIRARLMQVRFDNNVDPNHKFTKPELLQMRKDARNGNVKDHDILLRYDLDFLEHLFNDVADNGKNNNLANIVKQGGTIKSIF